MHPRGEGDEDVQETVLNLSAKSQKGERAFLKANIFGN